MHDDDFDCTDERIETDAHRLLDQAIETVLAQAAASCPEGHRQRYVALIRRHLQANVWHLRRTNDAEARIRAAEWAVANRDLLERIAVLDAEMDRGIQ